MRSKIKYLYESNIGYLPNPTRGTATILNLEGGRLVKRKMQVFNLEAVTKILRSYPKLGGWHDEFRNRVDLEYMSARRELNTHIEASREHKEPILLDFADNKIIRLADTIIRRNMPDTLFF